MLQAINFREKIPPKRRQENRPLVSYCLDPAENKDDMLSVEYQELTEYSRIFTDYYATWKHSVVYSTAYINQTIAFDEGDA